MSLSPLSYTILVLINIPCQVYSLHNVLVSSIIRYALGFSSTPLAILLVAWLYVPLFSPQLSSTFVAMPFVVLPHVLLMGDQKRIDHRTRVITNENIKGPRGVSQLYTKQVGTEEIIKYQRELKQKIE